MESANLSGKLELGKTGKQLTLEKRRLARKRWELLINVLTSRKYDIEPSISVRRFASFGLLQTEALECDTELMTNSITGQQVEKRHIWYKFTCDEFPQLAAVIRYLDGVLDVSDVLGFNNTGNVCVWPSEEVLTYYCLKHMEMFRGKSVCELGGGMTCLAGVTVALCSNANDVLLTDGNQTSVDNVNNIIKRNQSAFGNTKVAASKLRWDDVSENICGQYDVVICADCLFFDEYRLDLIEVIDKLLRPEGNAIIFAPSRGKTFQLFKDLLANRFLNVVQQERYDERVWDLHTKNLSKGTSCYDPDLHYPLMLTFSKQSSAL